MEDNYWSRLWDPNLYYSMYTEAEAAAYRRLFNEELDRINSEGRRRLRRVNDALSREEPTMPTLTVRANDPESHRATFKREYAVRDVRGGRNRLRDRYDNRIEAEHIRDRYNRESLLNGQGGEYVLDRRFIVEFEVEHNRAPGIRRYHDLLAAVLNHRELHLPPTITPDLFVREYVVGSTSVDWDGRTQHYARLYTTSWNEAKDYRDRLRAESDRYGYNETYSIRLRLRTLFRQTPDPFTTETPPRRRRSVADGVYAVAA